MKKCVKCYKKYHLDFFKNRITKEIYKYCRRCNDKINREKYNAKSIYGEFFEIFLFNKELRRQLSQKRGENK